MNYPTGVKKNITSSPKVREYKNLGMNLESDINNTNLYYIEKEKAYIYKKPTPITIAKVDYPSRKEAVIKEAYFKTPSTTDYNGIYKGKYIDFEAKETASLSFPLSNIHEHQIEHLKKVLELGGISLLIVRFTKKNITFLLETKYLISFINDSNRKSIPYEYFNEYGYIIKDKFNPRVDYLSIIDNLMEE